MKISVILAAGAGLVAAPALGQTSAAPATAPSQQPAAPAASAPAAAEPAAPAPAADAQAGFSPEEITAYAKAAMRISDIQKDAALNEEQRQKEMSAAVNNSGLAVDRFNAISQASQSDPAVKKRISTAITDLRMQNQPPFTDEDIANYAHAALKVNEIQTATTMTPQQKQAQITAVIQQSGLDVIRFNALSKESQADPELQKRVQDALIKVQQEKKPQAAAL